jgi:hypothetical protein
VLTAWLRHTRRHPLQSRPQWVPQALLGPPPPLPPRAPWRSPTATAKQLQRSLLAVWAPCLMWLLLVERHLRTTPPLLLQPPLLLLHKG